MSRDRREDEGQYYPGGRTIPVTPQHGGGGGDVKHAEFADMERLENATIRQVTTTVNTLITKLKGAALALAIICGTSAALADIGPDTEFGDVPPDTTIKQVVERSGAVSGLDTNAVNAVLAAYDRTNLTVRIEGKQDALPYPTNAVPASCIEDAPWLTEHQSLADYQPMLTAGANIAIDTNTWVISASGEGGTTDYDELANKPSIGGVVLSNDVTLARLGAASTGDLEDRVRFEWKTEHIDDETIALTNEWYEYNEGGVPYRHHVLIRDIKTQYPDTVMQLFPDFASFYVQTDDVTEVITDLHTHDSVTNTFYVNTSLEARGMSRIPLVQHIHQEQPGYAQDITWVQENLLFADFNAALHPQSTNEYLLGRVLRYIIQEASDVGTVTDNCNYVEIGFGINNDTGRTAVYYGSVNRKDLAFVDDLASCATTNDISHLSPRFSNEVLAVAESLIPAKVSDLTNDVGYITAETDPTVAPATNLIWQTIGDVNLLLETALGD